MKKIISLILIFSLSLLTACSLFESKEDILKKRYESLSDLNSKLEVKREEMESLQGVFVDDIDQLEEEISEEIAINGNMTNQETLASSRVTFNLKLLQQKRAYIKKLNVFQEKLKCGNEEVLFLTRKAESDLKICQVLDEKELSDLIKNVDEVIDEYLPYAEDLAIDVSEKELESQEMILNEIVQKSYYNKNGQYSYKINKLRRQIKKGEIDLNLYLEIKENSRDLISEGFDWSSKDFFSSNRIKMIQVVPEKIVFVKPYIIFGFRYTLYHNVYHSVNLNILDKDGVSHRIVKIIANENYCEDDKEVFGKEGDVIRVYYVLEYDDPEKFSSGTISQDNSLINYYCN